MGLQDLPDELLIEGIFTFLPPLEVLRTCMLVCKRWEAMARDNNLWRRFALQVDPTAKLQGSETWLDTFRRLTGTNIDPGF